MPLKPNKGIEKLTIGGKDYPATNASWEINPKMKDILATYKNSKSGNFPPRGVTAENITAAVDLGLKNLREKIEDYLMKREGVSDLYGNTWFFVSRCFVPEKVREDFEINTGLRPDFFTVCRYGSTLVFSVKDTF